MKTSTFEMSELESRLYLIKFGIAVVALPCIFIILYAFEHFQPNHISIRLNILAAFALVCIVLARSVLGVLPFRVLSPRVWITIAALTAIALSRLFVEENNFALSRERTVMWLVYLMFGLTLFSLFRKVSATSALVVVMIAVMGATMLYIVLVGVWWAYDGLPRGDLCTNSMPGFKNVRYTAYFSAPILGLAVAISAMPAAAKTLRLLTTGVAVALWMYIEYTGARGAALAIVAAGLLNFVIIPFKTASRICAAGGVAAVVGISLALLLPPPDCPSFGMFGRILETAQSDNPTTGRMYIWWKTWELITARPWFGYGEIRLYGIIDTPVTQPHNAVLQILLAWGFVGAVIFFALVGEFLIRLAAAARHGPWQAWPVLFGLMVFLFYGQISGALYHAFPLLFATILSAAAAALLLGPKPHPDA